MENVLLKIMYAYFFTFFKYRFFGADYEQSLVREPIEAHERVPGFELPSILLSKCKLIQTLWKRTRVAESTRATERVRETPRA